MKTDLQNFILFYFLFVVQLTVGSSRLLLQTLDNDDPLDSKIICLYIV